jgi:D-alanyl-D-alanine carboxypeptidase/D-alanyl-D-alanine-endopeptidase (penicillin-binding protein 4)
MPRLRFFVLRLLPLLLAAQLALAAPPAKDRGKQPSRHARELSARIEKILSQPEVDRGFWGIEVVSADDGQTLFSRNADKLFTPASNTKLFTTAAVLALIGPDYRFHTSVETKGTLDRYGRINGDVVLVGRGDPNLSGRDLANVHEPKGPPLRVLDELADQLVQKGVKFIDGDVIGDDSYFPFERYGAGWTQDDMTREWGAPVSALTINDNVISVSVLPGDRPGEKAFIKITPFPDYYRLDNRVLTTPPGTGPRNLNIAREPGSNLLTLWGTIPADDPGSGEMLAMEDPADFAARAFRQLLEQRGITIYGRARTRHLELASLSTFHVTITASAGGGDVPARPPEAAPPLVLASYESAPLMQDLRVVNKVSQNLHAELLLRLLGREKGTAGTIEAGSEVLRGFLLQAGIQPDEYVFYDGSGLSRQNLATPHAIVTLLRYCDGQTWGALFRDTLPIAGVDGTLEGRFRGAPATARVKAKTGSLGHVNVLSGYATTLRGQRLVFSIMANNHNLTNRVALQTIDQIVNAIVADRP